MVQTLFVSNRDVVVRSAKCGMSIAFKKGEPTNVPRVMHSEVMDKGILPVEDNGAPVNPAEHTAGTEPEKKLVLAPEDGEERRDKIIEAIKQIVTRNNAKDFTGGGQPSAGVLTAALGWRVDQKEVRTIWNENREMFKAEK